MQDNELMHYGVKGMKWGRKKSKVRTSSDRKSVKDMTDEELEDYVIKAEKRKLLEQRYKDLNPKQVSKGQKIVQYLGKNVVLPAVTDIGKQAVKSYLAKSINSIQTNGVKIGDTEYKIYANNKKKDK